MFFMLIRGFAISEKRKINLFVTVITNHADTFQQQKNDPLKLNGFSLWEGAT